jgi:hypothetical protein
LIDLALGDLTRSGTIRRIRRGLCDMPRVNEALGGKLSPDIDEAARAIARRQRWKIVPEGGSTRNQKQKGRFRGFSAQRPLVAGVDLNHRPLGYESNYYRIGYTTENAARVALEGTAGKSRKRVMGVYWGFLSSTGKHSELLERPDEVCCHHFVILDLFNLLNTSLSALVVVEGDFWKTAWAFFREWFSEALGLGPYQGCPLYANRITCIL